MTQTHNARGGAGRRCLKGRNARRTSATIGGDGVRFPILPDSSYRTGVDIYSALRGPIIDELLHWYTGRLSRLTAPRIVQSDIPDSYRTTAKAYSPAYTPEAATVTTPHASTPPLYPCHNGALLHRERGRMVHCLRRWRNA